MSASAMDLRPATNCPRVLALLSDTYGPEALPLRMAEESLRLQVDDREALASLAREARQDRQ